MRFAPKKTHFKVDVPAATTDRPSVLAFAFTKGGSTLLYNILQMLSPSVGLSYFSVANHLHDLNQRIDARLASIGPAFQPEGYCYGGFRSFPYYPLPLMHKSQAVLLVRDPRDMLTSLYFSEAFSHIVPGEPEPGSAAEELLKHRARALSLSIDNYAIENMGRYSSVFGAYLAQYMHLRPNVAIYRYEDIIYAKRDWIADLCTWYGWSVPKNVIDRVLARVDILPDAARPQEHVRQVAPGDHVRHLRPETIEILDGVFHDYLRLFEYSKG